MYFRTISVEVPTCIYHWNWHLVSVSKRKRWMSGWPVYQNGLIYCRNVVPYVFLFCFNVYLRACKNIKENIHTYTVYPEVRIASIFDSYKIIVILFMSGFGTLYVSAETCIEITKFLTRSWKLNYPEAYTSRPDIYKASAQKWNYVLTFPFPVFINSFILNDVL